jgi:hypothetical protein
MPLAHSCTGYRQRPWTRITRNTQHPVVSIRKLAEIRHCPMRLALQCVISRMVISSDIAGAVDYARYCPVCAASVRCGCGGFLCCVLGLCGGFGGFISRGRAQGLLVMQ